MSSISGSLPPSVGRKFVTVVRAALKKWQQNDASIRAAAIAFFIVLPFPSLLLITVGVYEQVYGASQGIQILISQIQAIAGSTVANLVSELLKSTSSPFTSFFGSLITIVFTAAGAVGAFTVLQDTLNLVWDAIPRKHPTIIMRIRTRGIPFILVFVSAVIVIFWNTFTVLLFGSFATSLAPLIGSLAASIAVAAVQIIISFLSAALLFAIIFKEIPDIKIKWTDVAPAALITSLVFTIINNVFGFYLRTFPVTTVVGAAGSLMLLLLWIFLTAEVLLYGAQFSKCYTEIMGSRAQKHQ